MSVNPRLLNGLLILLAIVNCIVVVIFELNRRPRVERHEITVVTNHVIVVTNYIGSVSSSSSTNLVSDLVRPSFSVNYKYHYFVYAGRRFAHVDGNEFLSRGSPTSYGRIEEIYPDRIKLDNGIWLVNVFRSDRSDNNHHQSNEVRQYDRVRDNFADL